MYRIKAKTEIVSKVNLISKKGNIRNIIFKKAEYPTLQCGNMKIVNTDKYNVRCWSIASESTLEFIRTSEPSYSDKYIEKVGKLCHNCDTCKYDCYNRYAYRFSSIIFSRMSNFYHTMDENFIHNMIASIYNYNERSKKEGKKLLIRLHVDGEMYSLNYSRKLMDICRFFLLDDNVLFYIYTKSYDIVEQLDKNNEIPSNLNVLLSLYDDLDEELKRYVLNSKHNTFYTSNTLESLPQGSKTIKCRGFNCANCSICYKHTNRKIIIHTKKH